MHVITGSRLNDYAKRHPDAADALRAIRQIFEKTDFKDIHAVRKTFPSADFAAPFTVINIKGNSYRLIVVIHYERKKVYVRDFLTHAAYDRWCKDRRS